MWLCEMGTRWVQGNRYTQEDGYASFLYTGSQFTTAQADLDHITFEPEVGDEYLISFSAEGQPVTEFVTVTKVTVFELNDQVLGWPYKRKYYACDLADTYVNMVNVDPACSIGIRKNGEAVEKTGELFVGETPPSFILLGKTKVSRMYAGETEVYLDLENGGTEYEPETFTLERKSEFDIYPKPGNFYASTFTFYLTIEDGLIFEEQIEAGDNVQITTLEGTPVTFTYINYTRMQYTYGDNSRAAVKFTDQTSGNLGNKLCSLKVIPPWLQEQG